MAEGAARLRADERSLPSLTELMLTGLARLVPPEAAGEPVFACLFGEADARLARRPELLVSLNRALPAPEEAALARLAAALDLADLELAALALALRAETDPALGAALSRLQAPPGGEGGPPRPSLGLAAHAWQALGARAPRRPLAVLAEGAAIASGLLRLSGEELPLARRCLSLPAALVPVLAGQCEGESLRARFGEATLAPLAAPDWPLPPRWEEEIAALAAQLARLSGATLALRSGAPRQARCVAQRIARALGRQAVDIGAAARAPGLVPWLLATGALPVWTAEAAPGERAALPALSCYEGARIVLTEAHTELAAAPGALLEWTLPVPPAAERIGLWTQALGAGHEALADEAGREHRIGVEAIHESARRALDLAARRGRAPGVAELREALAGHAREAAPRLASLARWLDDEVPDEALVTPAPLRRELALFAARCRARETLTDGLGVSARVRASPGVKALFVGAAGTGKTLAAQWLACRLGKPLAATDVGAVVSKYIGETEKNLAELLARAEHLDAILLFDEADSLFGARTDVRQASDRYANMQTNYLLQRIESYEGIVILTSNSRARFDDAFMRRLDAVIEFPLPGAVERRELWRAHLGEGHGLSAEELNRLAGEVDLAGGHIRNAVLTAALLARERGAGAAIALADVAAALGLEYAKLGRNRPDGLD